MVRQYQDNGSPRVQRSAVLRKFATAVFAAVCIAGPAMAWTWDAAPVRIVAPAGSNIDSGTVVTPSAVVINHGDSTASFPVLFSIGTSYLDTVDVAGLSTGDSITLTFADWIAQQRGSTMAACSTALAADESTANDRVTRMFTVRVRDVGVDRIVAPVDTINLGVTITPQAQVTNHGTSSASFQVKFRIGTVYRESTNVTNLASGASRTVSFTNWTPYAAGTFAVACSAAMSNDVHPENDLAQDSCVVRMLATDAGVTRVVAPTGVIDSGAVKTPQAMVRNYGSNTISFPVIFTISGTYADTQQVTGLASLDSSLVTFAGWTANSLGTFATRCSTALADDSLPSNDVGYGSVKVIVRTTDAGVARILAPADTVDSGAVVAPRALLRNYGLAAASFSVRFRIGSSYADTAQVDSLAGGDSLAVTFADYAVSRRGTTTAACSTMVTGDQDSTNDRVQKDVFRRVRDVGASSIIAPTGVVPFDTVVIPSATLQNLGNTTDSFPVIFRIGTFYEDTAVTSGSVVTFRPCTLSLVGTYATQCSTVMTGDVNLANDAGYDSVQVTAIGISASDQASAEPRTVTLKGTGPSVFAGRVAIVYGLPRETHVRLEVYDACGRPVQVIAAGDAKPGYHTVVWRCTDARGRAVPEGAYFVKLTADGVTLTSKVVKTE